MASKSILAFLALSTAVLAGSSLGAASVNVALSGASPANFDNRLNDTSVEAARFVLTISGGSVDLSGVTLSFSNAANADEAFSAVRLFVDLNGNQSFESPSEEFSPVGGIAPDGINGFLAFSKAFTLATGTTLMQVVVNTSGNVAAYGESFRFSIAAAADFTLVNPGTDNVTGSFPVQSNSITIRNSVTNLLSGTGNPAAPRTVSRGAQNVAGTHFRLDCLSATVPGELLALNLASITVNINLGSPAEAAVINSVNLHGDDFDAVFEPTGADTLIQSRTSADAAKWMVSGSTLTVVFDGAPVAALSVASGSVRAFWIGLSFNNSANAVVEVLVSRTGILGAAGAVGDFLTTGVVTVSGNVITVSGKGGGGGGGQGNSPGEEGGCVASPAGSVPWILVLGLLGLCLGFQCKRGREQATI